MAAQGAAAQTPTAEPRKRPSGRPSAARRRLRGPRVWRWSHAASKGAKTACTCSASGEHGPKQLRRRPTTQSAKARARCACFASAPSRSSPEKRKANAAAVPQPAATAHLPAAVAGVLHARQHQLHADRNPSLPALRRLGWRGSLTVGGSRVSLHDACCSVVASNRHGCAHAYVCRAVCVRLWVCMGVGVLVLFSGPPAMRIACELV